MEPNRRYSIAQLNSLSQQDFLSVLGPIFEYSPWIAETTWRKRPFTNLADLHRALCETLNQASEEDRLNLIRAHPDLVGRAALAGMLTAESNREQISAGLDQLAPDEITSFKEFNQAYREKFGFPFIICARLNKKEAILKSFLIRLRHSRAEEIKTALEQICQIAYLRLTDVVEDVGSSV